MRWWYALKNGWNQRAILKRFLTDREKQIFSLSEITLDKLDQANVAILVLDFDGVLGPHDALQPLPEAERWLTTLCQNLGEHRVAIFTNKPKTERLHYFAQRFPSIFVVQGVKKKPYPDGIWEVANFKGVPPHRVLLLDDRLLTGMLATCLAFSQGWYFCQPYRNVWRHPFKEVFFSFLRGVERTLFWLVPTNRDPR